MQDRFFNFSAQTYSQNGILDIDQYCNGINILNTGTSVCTVNGIPLAPPSGTQTVGDSYTMGGNRGEILKGRVTITFTGGTGQAVVVQKFYTTKDC